MAEKFDFYKAKFTSGIASHVSGIPEKLFSVWEVRGQVRRERRGKVDVGGKRRRGQEVFSILSIAEAKITYQLVSSLGITASEASNVAQMALVGDWDSGNWEPGDWRWPVWRSLNRDTAFPVLLLISRVEDCWNIDFCINGKLKTPEFDPGIDRPFAIVPIGQIIWSVYRQCSEILKNSD